MRGVPASKLFLLCALALGVACDEASAPSSMEAPDDEPVRPAFCGDANDEVSALFCSERVGGVESLEDLKRELGLDRVLLLGHSTALNGRAVSTINPRAIMLRRGGFEDGYTAAAFTRGEQRVELISLDADTERFNLYLMSFEQACNDEPEGCTPGDRFTPAIEADWRKLRIHNDEELKNTPEDCRRCHGGGPEHGNKPMLLMRELDAPWLHWFSQFAPLYQDYIAAKGDETYAGAAVGGLLEQPFLLESHVRLAEQQLGQAPQPISFLSGVIGLETTELQVRVAPPTPDEVMTPTWQLLYDAYRDGIAPAPPYHHARVTDDDKLAAATEAYRAFREGELAQVDLPDISDVLPDDRAALAEMSFAVDPDATGEQLLVQACGDCHNASLDQSLSRARFDVDLSRVTRATLELASARVERDEDDPSVMPPPSARTMTRAQRRALSEYLLGIAPEEVEPRPGPQATFDDYELEPGYGYQGSELPSDAVLIGDLSSDGQADLVCGPWLFEQAADGSFVGPHELEPMPSSNVALIDVNADGRLDVVSQGVAPDDATGLTTFVAQGEGGFAESIASLGPLAMDLARGNFSDVDGDGHVDLVTRSDPRALTLYRGDGAGSFEATALELELEDDELWQALALGDVAGDDAADLVLLRQRPSPALAVFPHDGQGAIAASGKRYPTPVAISSGLNISIGDANGDGRNDVATSPGIRLMLQEEDGGFVAGPVILVNAGPATFYDMNADGLQDLIALATDRGEVRVLLQGELGLTRPADIASFKLPSWPGTVLDMLEVGDIGGDGCPDVAVARMGSILVLHGSGCER